MHALEANWRALGAAVLLQAYADGDLRFCRSRWCRCLCDYLGVDYGAYHAKVAGRAERIREGSAERVHWEARVVSGGVRR